MAKVVSIIPLFFTSSLSQFAMDFGMQPDVRFGDQNDRFDVSSIIHDQNTMLGDDFQNYRRNPNIKRRNDEIDDEEMKDDPDNNKEDLLDALKETVDSRDFQYHDKMESSVEHEDYERNLANFEGKRRYLQNIVDHLHGGKSGRRGMAPDPESEILFHYGVPVNMKLEGYLQVPLGDK